MDSGTNRENLLFIDTNIIQAGYPSQRARSFHERLREEAQRLPGVRIATTADMVPLADSRYGDYVQIEGYDWSLTEARLVDTNAVAPRFF
jgi:hypothetical protein